jgi:hypothetical protein
VSGNGIFDGGDVPGFVAGLLGESGDCPCCDLDADNAVTPADAAALVNVLRTATACQP